MDKDKMAWYDKLRELREKSGMTQKEVCKVLGLNHETSYIRWENGKNVPLPIYRSKLAEVYDTTVEELFGLYPEPKN